MNQNNLCDIKAALSRLPESDKYVVALSGGVDSLVLLHALVQLNNTHFSKVHSSKIHSAKALGALSRNVSSIEAIHINHGLSPNAQSWAEHCQKFCSELGVDIEVVSVDVSLDGKGLEEAARKARYLTFEDYLQRKGTNQTVLLQGHHLDDQAETILFRALRGLNVGSLKGIPESRSLGQATLLRPLLNVPRSSIERYAQEHHLVWCDDESNRDSRFDRNFLRNEIIPLIRERWPNVSRQLANLSRSAEKNQRFIDEWCLETLPSITESVPLSDRRALDINRLAAFSGLQQEMLLRNWLGEEMSEQPKEQVFKRVWSELLTAKQDALPQLEFSTYIVCRFKSQLYCLKKDCFEARNYEFELDLNALSDDVRFSLPGGELRCRLIELYQYDNLDVDALGRVNISVPDNVAGMTVFSRKGGEKIRMQTTHSSQLKKLYQTQEILPWLRDSLPIIHINGEVVASLAGFVAYNYVFSNAANVSKSNVSEKTVSKAGVSKANVSKAKSSKLIELTYLPAS